MAGLRDAAGSILKDLSGKDSIRGAIIASRDGLLAMGTLEGAGDGDTVAAMAAASIAAIEAAGLDIGAGAISSLHAKGASGDLLIGDLDGQYVLVASIASSGDGADAFDAARKELKRALAG